MNDLLANWEIRGDGRKLLVRETKILVIRLEIHEVEV